MATLINNIDELKANFSSLEINFNWPSISSYEEDVERDIIAEFIGDEALEHFRENLTGLDGIEKNVLQLLTRSVAYLTVLKWTEFALFKISDRALMVAVTKDGVIPSDKKLHDLRKACETYGFNYLDKAIGLMEGDIDVFPDYKSSAPRQLLLQGFIKTAIEFSRLRNINNSRVTFMSLVAIMHDVQDEHLPHVMGEDYYAYYKQKYIAGTLSANEQKLLPFICKPVAYLTVSRACKELPVKITDKGLMINNFTDTREYEQANPADAARADYAFEDSLDKGTRKLNELKLELVRNAAIYPGFIVPISQTITPNDCDSGFFIM